MAAAPKKRPVATFDHLKKKPPQEIIRYVPIDGGASALRMAEAKNELDRSLMVGQAARTERAEAAYEQARRDAQSPEAAVRCVFRAIGRNRYQAIKSDHPPQAAEVAEAREAKEDLPDWNVETFAPALISASLTEPTLTDAEVRSLTVPIGEVSGDGLEGQGWNEAEYSELFTAALMVNNQSRITDFSF